ncbi:T9SS type A sorting domain-containing protein [bacterium]|nr:T9SS type A sorting domain-containing protein [bacterium]
MPDRIRTALTGALLVSLIFASFTVYARRAAESAVEWQTRSISAGEMRVQMTLSDVGATVDLSALPGIVSDGETTPVFSTWTVVPAGKRVAAEILGTGSTRTVHLEDRAGVEFPSVATVETGETVLFRGIPVAPIRVKPYHVDANGELQIATSVELRIRFTDSREFAPAPIEPVRISADLARSLSGRLLNLDEIDLIEAAPLGRILVLSPDDTVILEAIAPYILWKRRQGYPVTLLPLQNTTSSAFIKSQIQTEYDRTDAAPLEYVLLIGDTNGAVSLAADGNLTDHSYGRLDGADYLADVAVGRFSVRDLQTLHRVVGKTIAYERDVAMDDTTWFNRAVMTAGSGSGISPIMTKRSVKYMLEDHDITSDTLWFTMGGSIPNFIINEVNEGASFVNYRGFYGMSGWTNGHNDLFSNGSRMPIFVTITCGTGSFATQETAYSEGLFRAGRGINGFSGPVAAIGTATTSTHTRFNNVVDAGIFEAMLQRDFRSFGWALVWGKLRLFEAYNGTPDQYGIASFSDWNNLMGDPALRVWIGVPDVPDVTHPEEIASGANSFDVELDLPSGVVPFSWATLSEPDGYPVAVQRFNQSGRARLLFDGSDLPDSLMLTVAGDNLVPFQATIDVASGGDALVFDSYEMAEESVADDRATPGETLTLSFTLRNTGTQPSGLATVNVTSDDSRIDLDNPFSATLPTSLQPGETHTFADAITFELASWTPDGARPSLTIDAGGTVTALELPVQDWAYEGAEEPHSADDSILMPGESVELIFPVRHIGSVDAPVTNGTVESSHPGVSVSGTVRFPSAQPGDLVDNQAQAVSLTLEAEDDVAIGAKVVLTLALEGNGSVDTVHFDYYIADPRTWGAVGPDEHGYWAIDNEDDPEMSSMVPFFTWFDIRAVGTDTGLEDNAQHDDEAVVVPLPFEFGYYGETYDEVTLCTNGWMAFDVDPAMTLFRNWPIPNPQGPPGIIAPFWEDLHTTGGGVYYHHDEVYGRFIVQWNTYHANYPGSMEEFQAVLYDPAVWPTETGNGRIVFYYNEVLQGDNVQSDNDYATVGVESPDQSTGVQYSYWNAEATNAAPLQPQRAILFADDLGTLGGLPAASVSPGEFIFTVTGGQSATADVTIENVGEGYLFWSLLTVGDIVPSGAPQPGKAGRQALPNDLRTGGESPLLREGGPDGFGYRWKDSDEPDGPAFHWHDDYGEQITQWTPNAVNGRSEGMALGFNFPLYGEEYDSLYVCPNGFVAFERDEDWTSSRIHHSLPYQGGFQPIIAPLWLDLDSNRGGGVHFYTDGQDKVVVTWLNIQGAHGWGGPYRFQLILERNGSIYFQYDDVPGDDPMLPYAVVGLQDHTGEVGMTVYYSGPSNYLRDDLAVRIRRERNWAHLPVPFGITQAGESSSGPVSVSGGHAGIGEHEATLQVLTSDPDNTTIDIPIQLTVSPSNTPPETQPVPDQLAGVGQPFEPLPLDSFAVDPYYPDEFLEWDAGESVYRISIRDRHAHVRPPDSLWVGSDTVEFAVRNPEGYEDAVDVVFTTRDLPPGPFSLRNPSDGDTLGWPQAWFAWQPATDPETAPVLYTFHASTGGDTLVLPELADSGFELALDTTGLPLSVNEPVRWWVTASDTGGLTRTSNETFQLYLNGLAVEDDGTQTGLPREFAVSAAHPNPFNPVVTLQVALPVQADVVLTVYDVLGRKVLRRTVRSLAAGHHALRWDGTGHASGVYWFVVNAGREQVVRKGVLLK